jgi:hypothetical protein
MQTAVIADGAIEDEMKKALAKAGRDYPAVFLEPRLDDDPQKLRAALEAEMDRLPGPSTVLLGYGFSNGALVSFPAGRHRLAAPRAEDGLCLILGSQARRDALLKDRSPYLLTEGWLRGDDLFSAFERSVKKFGPEKAARLHKAMMTHYQRFLLIDTGAYDLDACRGRLQELGAVLGLAVEEAPGDLGWLERLVKGPPWGDDFAVAEPGEMLTISYSI